MKQSNWQEDQWPIVGSIILLIIAVVWLQLFFGSKIGSLKEEIKEIRAKMSTKQVER